VTGDDAAAGDLGVRVRERREALGLSVAGAARAAGIARGTWISLEAGTRETHPHQYAAIETALAWAPGSIKAIRSGGEPTPIRETGPRSGTTSVTVTSQTRTIQEEWARRMEEVQAIADNPDRSPGLRAWARAQVQQIQDIIAAARAEEEAERRRHRDAS
jgi:transcriptional regulator with XRE-family HTH domain